MQVLLSKPPDFRHPICLACIKISGSIGVFNGSAQPRGSIWVQIRCQKLKEAIRSIDSFADNVNSTINGLSKKMPLDVAVKFDEQKAKLALNQIEEFSSKAKKALGVLAGYFAVQGVTSFFRNASPPLIT